MTRTLMDEYRRWLDNPALDEREWAELNAIGEDESEIEARFASPLQFGTAGLRGVMGMGTARLNVHTVRHTAQALAQVLLADPDAGRNVAVCYDTRDNSRRFAVEAACVLCAAGLHVDLFREARPTPELSFVIRRFGEAAGMNLTASHNPKEYNGIKIYDASGAQLDDAGCAAVAAAMAQLDLFSGVHTMETDEAMRAGLLHWMGDEVDEVFLRACLAQCPAPEQAAQAALKVVYTPLHGTGGSVVPQALRRLGVASLSVVPEQAQPDGSFPTLVRPDPEYDEAYTLALALAEREDADLILASDPDADRLGVMARDSDGRFRRFSGNQLGVLLLDYLIAARREKGLLGSHAAAARSIVSTAMAQAVADAAGVSMDEAFTGFRFLAARMEQGRMKESKEYFFAFEESCGYLIGDVANDKDSVTAALVTAEMAGAWQRQGLTLWQRLAQLYEQFGCYAEHTLSVPLSGLDWRERAERTMDALRLAPPAQIAGHRVLRWRDYRAGTVNVPALGSVSATEISGSNVISFELDDGSFVTVRPSGTEPKAKIYLTVCGTDADDSRAKLGALVRWTNETLQF